MSAIGQILDTVEARVRELVSSLKVHEKHQDEQLADLARRVTALEGATPKKTAAAPAAKARPGTAQAKGQSQP